MARKVALTQRKAARVERRKQNVVRGKALNYNAAVQSRYVASLQAMVDEMRRITDIEVRRWWRGSGAEHYFAEDAAPSVTAQARRLMLTLTQRFEGLFAKAESAADRMMRETDASSVSSLHGSLSDLTGGLSLKTSITPPALRQAVQAGVAENVGLIRSISSRYLDQVQGAVMRSITTGRGLQDLVPEIAKQGEIAERRARNIALDQTRKAYNTVNRVRMEALGVRKFEWLHSGGGAHPRKEHQRMDGKIYSFDDPPVIDPRTGERGFPGQAPNCRCRMLPVIEFDDEEAQADAA